MAATLLILWWSSSAWADELTVRFNTFGEPAPSHVCVVADFVTVPANELKQSPVTLKEFHSAPSDASGTTDSESECSSNFRQPTLITPEGESVPLFAFCTKSATPGGEGVAIIRVANAVVKQSTLTDDVARLRLEPSRDTRGLPAEVQLLGGDYHERSPVAFHLSEGAQLVDLPLAPLCVERLMQVPKHDCKTADESERSLSMKKGRLLQSEAGWIKVLLPNPRDGHGRVEVEHCEHTLFAVWRGPVPPPDLELQVLDFWFAWDHNCLAPPKTCPQVQMEGISVSCEATYIENLSPTRGNACVYGCSGAVRFPTPVRFAFPDGSITNAWRETLSFPGQILYDYVAPEQRRVRLDWQWKAEGGDRDARKEWSGDAIQYVEIRTPEGRLHRVHTHASQIRVPELDCDDYLEYRYVGTRRFREQEVAVSDGKIILKDPSKLRADKIAVALAAGGGLAWINSDDEVAWGPQGALDVIVISRHSQDWWDHGGAAIDLEVRAGAIFSQQPHCSRVLGSFGNEDCDFRTWEQLPFWRFPITIGYNVRYAAPAITHGLAVGLGLSTYHVSEDAEKLRRPVMFTGRAHIGYQFSSTWSAEFYLRPFFGGSIVETRFDDAGLVSRGPRDDGQSSIVFGSMIRAEDLF